MSTTFNGQMVGFMLKERLGWDRPDVFPSAVELEHDCDRDNPYVVDGNVFYDRRKVRYVPERTCHPICVDREDENGILHKMFHRCSFCGHDLPYEAEKGHCNYCPHCGARVVEGDSE